MMPTLRQSLFGPFLHLSLNWLFESTNGIADLPEVEPPIRTELSTYALNCLAEIANGHERLHANEHKAMT